MDVQDKQDGLRLSCTYIFCVYPCEFVSIRGSKNGDVDIPVCGPFFPALWGAIIVTRKKTDPASGSVLIFSKNKVAYVSDFVI